MQSSLSQPHVQSVERSLELLETLARVEDLGLVEIAAQAGLQPSTAHRLLATLVAHGYVVQSATNKRYLLGYKLAELADALNRRSERLRSLANPHLRSIRQATGESVSLTMLEPPNVVYVDQIAGTQSVRMFARIGASVQAHATAAGKAMLAFMAPDAVAAVVGEEPFAQLTSHTISSLAALDSELKGIRQLGYAVDNEEHELGVGCVAAPIFDHAALVVAAISVSAPMPRIEVRIPSVLGELLMERATSISSELGWSR
jgi:DNA-binding IclR family transcriptional regulator